MNSELYIERDPDCRILLVDAIGLIENRICQIGRIVKRDIDDTCLKTDTRGVLETQNYHWIPLFGGLLSGCSGLSSQLSLLGGSELALTIGTDLESLNGTLSGGTFALSGECRPSGAEIALRFSNRDTGAELTSPSSVFCSSDLKWSMSSVTIPNGRLKAAFSLTSSGLTFTVDRYLVWGLRDSSISYDASTGAILYYQIPISTEIAGVSISKYQYAVGCSPQGTGIPILGLI